jgi:hypothetical protein
MQALTARLRESPYRRVGNLRATSQGYPWREILRRLRSGMRRVAGAADAAHLCSIASDRRG